jgi:hypothetical protein
LLTYNGNSTEGHFIVTAKNGISTQSESKLTVVEGDWRWELTKKVAHSAALSRATQLRAILLYLVRQAILQPEETINESEIASRALGRRSDFNPLDDSIVRVQVAHLRKKLDLYFSTEGKNWEVVLTIALGSYQPVFSNRSSLATNTRPIPETEIDLINMPRSTGEGMSDASEPHLSGAVPKASQALGPHRWLNAERLVAVLIVLVLAGGCVALWIQNRAMSQSFYAWKYKPSIRSLWSDILTTSPHTDVIVGDSSFALLQAISKQPFGFSDYLGRGYIGQIQAQNMNPDRRSDLDLIAGKSLGSVSEFRLAQRILALNPVGGTIHLYSANEYMPSLIKQDNVIVIGSRIANPWGELFESQLNFIAKSDANGITNVINRAPAAGEQQIYVSVYSTVEYCVVAYLPNPDHRDGKVLLIEGTGSEATESAGDFLLSEDLLSSFQKMLRVAKLPYFEVLLKISAVKGTPLTATVVAYRTYPNLH